jgi:hypothetical protein
MTETILLIGLIAAIVWFGGQILDRLPKSKQHKDFAYAESDYVIGFKVDAVTEQDFEIQFVDGWGTGRRFTLYGQPALNDDVELRGGLDFGKRTGVHIHPTAEWFKQSRIGYLKSYDSGGCESHIYLPYQIARHVLEDVRRDLDQFVRIGFGKTTGENGKIAYPIYMFELSEPIS